MQKLHLKATETTPEIYLSPDDNTFIISGNSSPEDVRALYYPVIEWMRLFIGDLLEGDLKIFNNDNPFRFKIDLSYFNSSSAKFIYDILLELKRLHTSGIPVIVEWHYEEEDNDMKEAGADISLLAEMDLLFVPTTREN